MPRCYVCLALVFCVTLLGAASLAQQAAVMPVPNLIRYGGTLQDAHGSPLSSSTVGVTYAIYSRQQGGAALWIETQNVTTDAAGNYGVLLGATTANGLPADLFSQPEQRWLGVQVQGEAEQPRVLMVSVPYAFKAHEAETLGGRSVSDFVLASGTNSGTGGTSNKATSASGSPEHPAGSGISPDDAASAGPTNFMGSTIDQIVGVTQSGTGVGINATATSKAIVGTATDPTRTAYGVQGVATGESGVGLIGTATSTLGFTYGLRGTSSSSSGTGVRGIDNATFGVTTGVSGYVSSSAGTAGVFNNAAGGKILTGQNNGSSVFTLDGFGNITLFGAYSGNGNVTTYGNFIGGGSGITGLTFSQLTGQLASSQFSGTYSNAVTLSNTANAFAGDGSALTGIQFSQLNGQLGGTQLRGTYTNAVSLTNSSNSFIGNGAGLTGMQFSQLHGQLTSFQLGGTYVNALNFSNPDNSFTGDGSGLTGIQFSQLLGTLGDTQLSGTYSGALTFSNTANVYDGSSVTISGTGTANAFNSATSYQIGGSNILSIGTAADNNLFVGVGAGPNDVTGFGAGNMFSGFHAGNANTTGAGNIYVGYNSGSSNTTDNNNIYIGNAGTTGESSTIRIGGDTGLGFGAQTKAFLAGVYGSTSSSGVPVYINSNGQLGTLTSSFRFKEQVRDMGDSTSALLKLRPVTFIYKPDYDDGSRTLQYGLIAEEVAQVYPELVAYGADGKPYTVRYQYLSTMLLNEVQKQYRRAEAEAEEIKAQRQEIDGLKQQLQLQNATLQERLSRLERLVNVRDDAIAAK